MAPVTVPTVIVHNSVDVVTFGAQCVGAAALAARRTEAGVWIQVCDEPARSGGLTHLVPALQDVREDRPMGPIWPLAAKFSIVVAVVAIGAKDPVPHLTSGRSAVKIQHVSSQAGLWQGAAPIMKHRMA